MVGRTQCNFWGGISLNLNLNFYFEEDETKENKTEQSQSKQTSVSDTGLQNSTKSTMLTMMPLTVLKIAAYRFRHSENQTAEQNRTNKNKTMNAIKNFKTRQQYIQNGYHNISCFL